MGRKTLRRKALDLLEPFERRYYPTLSDVHWIEQDGCSTEGDFCEGCIKKALANARKRHKERRAEVKKKFKEIEETGAFQGQKIKGVYSANAIKKAKRYELKQIGVAKFSSTYNYGGGYEQDDFLLCELCGDELNVSILPNCQNIQDAIDDLKDGKITDQIGYHAHCLIYDEWNDEKHKREIVLGKQLSRRVIEILGNGN